MEQDTTADVSVRPATQEDRTAVLGLIRPSVDQKRVLRRTVDELNDLLARAFVAVDGDRIVGFVALDIYSRKLAEVRSLVVASDFQSRGVGRKLVTACVDRAREQGVLEVMAISSLESFFLSCGFDFTLPDEKKAFFFQTGDRDWRKNSLEGTR